MDNWISNPQKTRSRSTKRHHVLRVFTGGTPDFVRFVIELADGREIVMELERGKAKALEHSIHQSIFKPKL